MFLILNSVFCQLRVAIAKKVSEMFLGEKKVQQGVFRINLVVQIPMKGALNG